MIDIPRFNLDEVIQFQGQIVDIRDKISFSKAHIANSINIPLGPSLTAWARRILSLEIPILIISDHYPMNGVCDALLRLGFSQIAGIFAPFEPLERLNIQSIPLVEVSDLQNQLIIDVRTDEEWKEGHIKNALHIEVDEKDKVTLPKDQHIAVICASGNRASIFASLLKRDGYKNVENVKGGMMAWVEAELPIVKN